MDNTSYTCRILGIEIVKQEKINDNNNFYDELTDNVVYRI